MSEPTTPHAPASDTPKTDSIEMSNPLPGYSEYYPLLEFARQLEREIEQTRLNGCEAVRRSEEAHALALEAAFGKYYQAEAILKSAEECAAYHGFRRKGKNVGEELQPNIRDMGDCITDFRAKLAAETALREATQKRNSELETHCRLCDSENTYMQQRDALAAQVAGFREACTRAVEFYKEGWAACQKDKLHVALQFSHAADAVNNALTATPASASAEIVKCGGAEFTSLPVAELMAAREDTARLDAAEVMLESFICWKFKDQPKDAGNDWTNGIGMDGDAEIHGDTLRELIDNLRKQHAARIPTP